MLRQAASLAVLLVAGCSAEPHRRLATEATETSGVPGTPDAQPGMSSDLAGDSRAFFFAQADLYQAGAAAGAGSQLADMLRAMGREDLVDPAQDVPPANRCPRQWVEPAEMVAQSIDSAQLVIIESQHNAPAQLAFVEKLVVRLAAEGFSVFADDALALGPGGSADPDVPLVTEGQVTRDTTHGRLVRTVKAQRLKLVDAGVWWVSPGQLASLGEAERALLRQQSLADQLSRRVFARDPAARVIFHTEHPAGPVPRSFKEEVERLTGHEPVIISLTSCTTGGGAAYQPYTGYGTGANPEADMVFAVPRPQSRVARMTSRWGRNSGEVVNVPPSLMTTDLPVLVEARRAGDPELAVPEDRLMLFPGDQLPLILPPGEYRIEAWTKNGPLARAVAVRVG